MQDNEKQTIQYYEEQGLEWANRLEEGSFWTQDISYLTSLMPDGGSVFDIGCGTGREAKIFIDAGYNYTGIDPSQTMLDEAKKNNPGGDFYQLDVYRLATLKRQYDAFFSAACFLHIPKQRLQKALKSVHKSLKRRAVGFISLKEGEGEVIQEETGRLNALYTVDEFTQELEKAGFTVFKVEKRDRPNSDNSSWLLFFIQKG